MWSVGCILYELLYVCKDYTGESTDLKKQVDLRYPFRGTSCFPLSPCEKAYEGKSQNTNIISQDDQLIKINQVLGKLSPEDLSFIQNKNAQQYEQ